MAIYARVMCGVLWSVLFAAMDLLLLLQVVQFVHYIHISPKTYF